MLTYSLEKMSDPGNNEDNGVGAEPGEEEALLETEKTVEPPPSIRQLWLLNEKLQQSQAPVGELADIMRLNVEKILERYPNYSELNQREDDLIGQQSKAESKREQTIENQEQYLLKFIKLGAIICIVLLVITIIAVLSHKIRYM